MYQTRECDGTMILIPEAVSEVRFMCSENWGEIIDGDYGSMNLKQATAAGIAMGASLSFVIVKVNGDMMLAAGKEYDNEIFSQVWFIPVEGELANKKGRANNRSVLCHTMLRGRSRDALAGLTAKVIEDSFAKGLDPADALATVLDSTIFDCQMVLDSNGVRPYYWVQIGMREPANDFEKNCLTLGQLIRHEQEHGDISLSNPRVIPAAQKQQLLLGGTVAGQAALPSSNGLKDAVVV